MLILLVLLRTFRNLATLKYQCNKPLKLILLESYSLKKRFSAKLLSMKNMYPSYLIDKQVKSSYVINFPQKSQIVTKKYENERNQNNFTLQAFLCRFNF